MEDGQMMPVDRRCLKPAIAQRRLAPERITSHFQRDCSEKEDGR